MTSFCVYVEEDNVNIKKLKIGIKGVVRLPPIYVDDETATCEDINVTNDTSNIILVIRSHCTFIQLQVIGKFTSVDKVQCWGAYDGRIQKRFL